MRAHALDVRRASTYLAARANQRGGFTVGSVLKKRRKKMRKHKKKKLLKKSRHKNR